MKTLENLMATVNDPKLFSTFRQDAYDEKIRRENIVRERKNAHIKRCIEKYGMSEIEAVKAADRLK
jgi:predicted alpha/beta hydrolase